MDITLERILSLIPKKPDGAYVHGAKKEFAVSIGYDSGDIISMWIKGTSDTYKNKLYEISAKYKVSVDWLKGESDEKEIPPAETGSIRERADALLACMSNEELLDFIAKATEKLKGQ